MVTGLRGFVFDPGDPSVGLFGSAWVHEDCPLPAEVDSDVIETPLAEVRSTPMTVRRWWMLTCTDCVQQVIVTDTDYDPDDEALSQADADAGAAEAWHDTRLAQYDDDPNPYHGDYSEM